MKSKKGNQVSSKRKAEEAPEAAARKLKVPFRVRFLCPILLYLLLHRQEPGTPEDSVGVMGGSGNNGVSPRNQCGD
jgi:hypothetical protein